MFITAIGIAIKFLIKKKITTPIPIIVIMLRIILAYILTTASWVKYDIEEMAAITQCVSVPSTETGTSIYCDSFPVVIDLSTSRLSFPALADSNMLCIAGIFEIAFCIINSVFIE